MLRRTFVASVAAGGFGLVASELGLAQAATPSSEGARMAQTASKTGYAPVNGLQMYYEIRGGGGVPLLLLHGAFSNIETDFGKMLPSLAANRQVIGVEQQAHGRTADSDRPLSYEQMADDTAALLRFLGIDRVDIVGYSAGGAVGFQLAVRHPEVVRKLVAAGGTSYRPDGLHPELMFGSESMTAADLDAGLAGTPWQEAYSRMAPNLDDWLTLVEKKMDMDRRWQGWPPEMIQAIEAPTLLMIGDSDIVRPEHTVEFFRLLGGGVPGDLTGLPKSWLAILPGTTHVSLVTERADLFLAVSTTFLDAPMP
jgi:pimeloyl-ACP methyl ester carboxylesterase